MKCTFRDVLKSFFDPLSTRDEHGLPSPWVESDPPCPGGEPDPRSPYDLNLDPRDLPSELYWQRYLDSRNVPTWDTGSLYPCTPEGLWILRHAHELPENLYGPSPKYISARRATKELEAYLDPPQPLEDRACDALKRLQPEVDRENWTPDLFIKIFNDLDRAFFGRALMNKVCLKWRSRAEMERADTEGPHIPNLKRTFARAHMKRWRPVAVAEIVLNAEALLLLPLGDGSLSRHLEIWATLLHEMVHAYFMVVTGRWDDPVHGLLFQRCMYAVNMRARATLGFEDIGNGQPHSLRKQKK